MSTTPGAPQDGPSRSGDLFAWQRALRSCPLPREVRATLLMLSTWMDRHGAGAHPSLPMLADAVGCHRTTVTRHLAEAEKHGWLKRTPGGGRGRATSYTATMPAGPAGSVDTPAQETGARVHGYQDATTGEKGCTGAPVSEQEPAHGCTETGAPVHGNGCTGATPPPQDQNKTTPKGAGGQTSTGPPLRAVDAPNPDVSRVVDEALSAMAHRALQDEPAGRVRSPERWVAAKVERLRDEHGQRLTRLAAEHRPATGADLLALDQRVTARNSRVAGAAAHGRNRIGQDPDVIRSEADSLYRDDPDARAAYLHAALREATA